MSQGTVRIFFFPHTGVVNGAEFLDSCFRISASLPPGGLECFGVFGAHLDTGVGGLQQPCLQSVVNAGKFGLWGSSGRTLKLGLEVFITGGLQCIGGIGMFGSSETS